MITRSTRQRQDAYKSGWMGGTCFLISSSAALFAWYHYLNESALEMLLLATLAAGFAFTGAIHFTTMRDGLRDAKREAYWERRRIHDQQNRTRRD